jgi:hypothetical protein
VSPELDQTANDWLRRKNRGRVKVGSSTFRLPANVRVSDDKPATVDVSDGTPQPTPEEAAAAGGANGGERGPEPKPSFDDQIREAFWGSGSLRGRGF